MNKTKSLLLVVFSLVSYLILHPQFLSQAAEQESQSKNQTQEDKNAYVPGEVLFKLKEPIEELTLQNKNADFDTIQKTASKNFDTLDANKVPPKLLEIHNKHNIVTIEKLFPQIEEPEVELGKLKNQFTEDLENSEYPAIDEEKFLSHDLSTIYMITFDPETSVEEVINDLTSDPSVEYAEPNYIATLEYTPNDPLYPMSATRLNQWGLENPGRPGSTVYVADSDIDASAAWDIHKGSASTVVAIIDTGIDYTHPDLGGGFGSAYKVKGGYDFANTDSNPMDDNGHGTHVAGIVAATINNGIGISGVCPNCKLLAVKTHSASGSGNYSKIAQGVTYASSNGARVINISVGGTFNSPTLDAAVQSAFANNVVIVGAAGNNNNSTLFYPAAHDNVLSVANTNEADKKAGNSNYGTWIDISAPGSSILSTSLTGGALCAASPHESGTPRYSYCGGTSMAAPMVAGVAGLMISKSSTISATLVSHRLKVTADDIYPKNPSYINKLGSGRLNAHRAITSNDIIPAACANGRCTASCTSTSAPAGLTMSGLLGIDYPSGSAPIYYLNPGNSTFSWSAVSGVSGYHLRIDDESNGWVGAPWNGLEGCNTPNSGDACRDISTPTTTHTFRSLKSYKISFISTGWCRTIYVETY